MSVDATHSQYDQAIARWQKCRDAVEGSEAIKAKGTTYLPMLGGHSSEDYASYKERALYYNASGRTVDGLTGSAFRKEIEVQAPEAIEPHLKDITLTGVPFQAFGKTTLRELLTTGRYGILVDMSTEEGDRPYFVGYRAEAIINWRVVRTGGKTVPSLVVLQEIEEVVDPSDRFTVSELTQYRVLELVDGLYQVTIWRKSSDENWSIIESFEPSRRGARLDYIPFVFVGPNAITPEVDKPPVIDLVEVNISHYRSSADLEHGRHFTALPTPWVAGFDSDTKLRIGSATAWVTDRVDAKVGMLEFTGQGLKALETAIEQKEKMMAALGARLLEEQKAAAEAAETVRLRQAGEQSTLQSMVNTTSLGLTQALRWHAEWAGVPGAEVTAQVNKDFFDTRLSSDELRELVGLWQAGGMSWETLYSNLEAGEITRAGVTADEERQLIDAESPKLGDQGPDVESEE